MPGPGSGGVSVAGVGITRFINASANPSDPMVKYQVYGTILDPSTGVPVAGATVKVFETVTNLFVSQTTTDAVGYWQVDTTNRPGVFFQAFFYLAGARDLAGCTANVLVGM